jgi:hypothetical protein
MSSPDDIFNQLVLKGALKFVGNDPSTGEPLYVKTDILKQVDPKLEEDLSLYFSQTTMNLWQNGFIDMDVTLPDPVVKLTDKSLDRKELESLDKNERIVIEQIIKLLLDKK